MKSFNRRLSLAENLLLSLLTGLLILAILTILRKANVLSSVSQAAFQFIKEMALGW